MIKSASTDSLFKLLQNAITSKLRSVTHTDAVRLWEQDIRRYVLECLIQKAKFDAHVANTLTAIPQLDQVGGVKLATFLDQMAEFTGQLQKSKCTYPLRLMQAVVIKPMNVQAALDHLDHCESVKLTGKQLYCVNILKAELLSATGKIQEAYELLKPLLSQKGQTMSLRLSYSMRFARLAKTRNTAEAQNVLIDIVEQIDGSKASAYMWKREFAESTHDLATLLMQCGHHQEALQWVQRSLQAWHTLCQDHPHRMDAQLLQAAALRTLSFVQDELGQSALSQSALTQATHIVEKLLAQYPGDDILKSELPKNHDVIGDIHMGNLDLDKALKEYSASAAIGAHLHSRDPQNIRWRIEEISSAMRIAHVLKKMGRHQEALSMLTTYRLKLDALLAQDPENLEHRATMAQMSLQVGDLYWLKQDHLQAAIEFREALTQLKYALDRDAQSTRWLLMHLMVKQRLAELEISTGELDKAFEILSIARDVISNALSQDIHTKKLHQFFVAINTRLSDCAFNSGKTSVGMEVQKQTLQQATHYQKERPDSMSWLTLLCRVQTHASRDYLKLGLMQESRALWEKAILGLQRQSEQHPGNIEIADYLVQARLLEVEWLCQQGELEEAHRIALILLTQIRVSNKDFSDTSTRQSLWCECLEHFAFCCHHLEKNDQEMAALKELERIRKDLLMAHPESVPLQTQYYELLMAMGKSALKTGLAQQGEALLQEALKGFNDLHEKHSNNPNYLLSIGDILVCLGQTYQQLNNAAASQLTLNKALQVADWLGKVGHDSYVMQLAATKIFFAVSQSSAYATRKKDLLKLAESQAKHLHVHSQNPAVNSLLEDISQQQAMA
jgi:tetratricopeptide (TPR) repeat protein